jgi:ubiquinol-cytochrome c reductase cytochrome b subunit
LLDRPRDRPVRTAFGVATLSFYTVLFLAGGDDVLASTFGLSIQALVHTFQVCLLVVPVLVGLATWKICRELSSQNVHPIQQPVGGIIVRTADGGYELVDGHDSAVEGGTPLDGGEAEKPVAGKQP